MTNEETIEQLKIIKQSLIDCGGCKGSRTNLDSIDLAIEALQEKNELLAFLTTRKEELTGIQGDLGGALSGVIKYINTLPTIRGK